MTEPAVLEVQKGRGDPSTISLVPGTVLDPTSIGKKGMWRIDGPGVMEVHGYLYYDGKCLYVQSADDASPVLVNKHRVATAWTEVRLPSTIEVGQVELVYRADDEEQAYSDNDATVARPNDVARDIVRDMARGMGPAAGMGGERTMKASEPTRAMGVPLPVPGPARVPSELMRAAPDGGGSPSGDTTAPQRISAPGPAAPFRPGGGVFSNRGLDDGESTRFAPIEGLTPGGGNALGASGSVPAMRPFENTRPEPVENSPSVSRMPVVRPAAGAPAPYAQPTPMGMTPVHGVPMGAAGVQPQPMLGMTPQMQQQLQMQQMGMPGTSGTAVMPGMAGGVQPGMMQQGMMGGMQPGMMQPGMMQPGMMQPGMMQPGMMQQGMMPGMQPGMMPMQPGMMPMGGLPPGMTPGPGMAMPSGPGMPPWGTAATGPQATQPAQHVELKGLDKFKKQWNDLPGTKKVIYVILPFALLSGYSLLADSDPPPPPRKPVAAADAGAATTTAAANANANAGAAAGTAATAGTAAGSATTTGLVPGSGDTAQGGGAPTNPAGTGATTAGNGAAAGTTASTATAAADAGATTAAATTSAGDGGAVVLTNLPSNKRTKERAAADAWAEGNFEQAAKLYEELAQQNPQNPAFKEAARILRERLDAGVH